MNIKHYIYFGMLYGTIVIFIFRYNKLAAGVRPLILYLAVLAAGTTLAMYLRHQLNQLNNSIVFHFLTPLEYLSLCLVFYRSAESSHTRRLILVSAFCFPLIAMLLSLYVDSINGNNTYARVLVTLLSTIWILLYLKQLSTTEKILNVTREPLFWVYTGLLFYFLGTLFLQGLLNTLVTSDGKLARQLYSIQYFFDYALLININIALFCQRIFSGQAVNLSNKDQERQTSA